MRLPVAVAVTVARHAAKLGNWLAPKTQLPLGVSTIVPVGIVVKPGPLSKTLMAQDIGSPIETLAGEQEIPVEVGRKFTVTVVEPLLPV